MKIEVDSADIVLTGNYNGVGIQTDDGLYGVCQRDGGIEILLDGQLMVGLYGGSVHVYPAHSQRTVAVEIRQQALPSDISGKVTGEETTTR